ncbi:hypothetical protein CWI36_0021p0020 [Hamiltosporidium magnivora]|uniref:Uncharacterized protein n=1 Tax=Hamiltosporidium magnivora TaxID=148818 RepID=A0A4V2JWY3_9MICR|nr:hypothetical protein CWI36_0021p0020 [Hamiltosporidium magnivora]
MDLSKILLYSLRSSFLVSKVLFDILLFGTAKHKKCYIKLLNLFNNGVDEAYKTSEQKHLEESISFQITT